ncbi:MAG: MqnA/MqnD/SBP family protein [Candidatus Omnitrophota bacterium]|jgi:1,4-dihydroxy-6-naphthoate synthase
MTTPPAEPRLIRVGHSPDPDDAFMFYALAKGKIPMRGFRVEHVIEEIERLNQRALEAGPFRGVEPLEVTAVSCHAYAYLAGRYAVMRAGSSVGDKYGPVVIGRAGFRGGVKGRKVAVPGKLTTAYLTLQLYERDFEPVFVPFDRIFEAVAENKADLGLVIHEGQITFQDRGFTKVVDLGEWWQEKTGLVLPLGVDVIRRDLGDETVKSFAALFKESILYALAHRDEALSYALEYGRGIGRDLGDRFVGMYVNDYTVDLGPRGIAGFERLLAEGFEKGLLPEKIIPDYI